MSVFLERLRAALGADYDVLDELASGGMGVVYRARDRTLDRLVAIKIIRPDLATASMRERFLREARVLASFSHPNIVPVHRAGEADGMAYYVMDFLHGETLADRLRRGPLTAAEFRMVANDLLAALEVVHEHGVVHRDVKPSNVFMTTGRAVLSDFGISKPASGAGTDLTAPGHIVGTPGYMPPEQLAGSDVTVRTDIAAAAMVLFEACTGTPWNFDSHSEEADWSRVPAAAAPVIRRALAWSPSERLASAGEFRAALAGQARPNRRLRVGAISALAMLTAIVAYAILSSGGPTAGGPLHINVYPLVVQGAADSSMGRAMAAEIIGALRSPPDLEFSLDSTREAGIEVHGWVEQRGESLAVRLRVTGSALSTDRGASFDVPATGTRADVVESLARALLLGIWDRADSSFADLPVGALPQSPAGLNAWAHAEALWAGARWGEAEGAYRAAIRTDSTCALCDLRLMLITRWLRRTPDAAMTRRVVDAIDHFPARYQQLIRAGMDTVNRWAALDALIAAWPRFDLAQFVYGDELFHRGALAGKSRRDALGHFENLIALRPNFAPAYQHLAWVAIPEGDRAVADSALAAYRSLGAANDLETLIIQGLLQVGYAWRFTPDDAPATTEGALSDKRIAGFADLNLATRYMYAFDAPAGIRYFGERFERWTTKPRLRKPGIVAQVVGLTAAGMVDSARATLRRLRGESAAPENALVSAEFEAALVLFDSLDAAAALPRLTSLLAPPSREGAGSDSQRRRAAWMLALVARRAGHANLAREWQNRVNGESGHRPLATLLDADAVGRADPRNALRLTAPLLDLDSAGGAGDPFFRTALHLMRAHWQAASGDSAAAVRSLLWHENYDLVGHFDGVMEAADVDAAFGTVGRWYRARLWDQSNAPGVCGAYAGAARLWAEGDPRYRARAVGARAAAERLGCTGP